MLYWALMFLVVALVAALFGFGGMHPFPEHAGALDAFRLMGRLDCPRLIVVDPAGRMTGIVSEGDLVRAIQVRMMGFQVVNPTSVQVQRAVAGISPSPAGLGFGYTHADAPRDPQRYARPL